MRDVYYEQFIHSYVSSFINFTILGMRLFSAVLMDIVREILAIYLKLDSKSIYL